jgi:hypothetical protein
MKSMRPKKEGYLTNPLILLAGAKMEKLTSKNHHTLKISVGVKTLCKYN